MKRNHIYYVCQVVSFLIVIQLAGCKQDEWLDIKSNKSDVSPKTLQDMQAILDNTTVFNISNAAAGLASSDNIYVPDVRLDGESTQNRNTYLWAKDIYEGEVAPDWYYSYQVVVYTNIVLEGLDKLSEPEQKSDAAKAVRGQALFFRSYAFYQLCQLYCKPYNMATAAADPGIPIRLSSDVNLKISRSSVQESYDRMIADLREAATLLPANSPYQTRPSSNTANALLAKVYLSMGDYSNALKFADISLTSFDTLLDFNTLRSTTGNPFPSFAAGNPEIIFYAYTYASSLTFHNSSVSGRVAPELYSLYDNGDLRRTAFYIADGATGLYRAKASYSGRAGNFCGIANNEIYLIRAECAARSGNLNEALKDLNMLLRNRYSTATFIPFSTTVQSALISKILEERRKELAFVGNMRWEDLRRLNQEPQYAKTVSRIYKGTTYNLVAGDNRYVFPLPADEISLQGLTQNPR